MKRASVVETIVGDARIVKGQGDATAAFSFYVAWFLFALLSRAYFMDSFHVLDSCWFTLAASVSFSITMAFCSFRHVSCQTFRLSRLSFFGAVAAAAISLILMAFIPSLPGFHAVVGCLVGLSLALALSVAHRVLGKGSRREGLVFSPVSSAELASCSFWFPGLSTGISFLLLCWSFWVRRWHSSCAIPARRARSINPKVWLLRPLRPPPKGSRCSSLRSL